MIELPGYKIIRELGRGGMARVYLATHESLQRDVAIKVMFNNLGDDTSFSDRFLREARIVAQLSHHNIITVYDVAVHDDNYYIAMEFLPGETLDDKIKAGIKPEYALKLIKQISAGLQYAHNKKFIHRDIKPENILFREDNTAVISDFGISRAAESETKMTEVGTVIGTATYMSPEQAQGKPITCNADLYSLGIVFHEMLTGKVPYAADSSVAIILKHLTDPIPELDEEHQKYQSILNKMMAKNPKQRYQSGNEIISDIEALEQGNKPPRATEYMAHSATAGGRGTELINTVPGSKSQWKWIITGTSILIFISGAAAYYMVYIPQQEQQIAEQQRIDNEQQKLKVSEQKRLADEKKRQQLAEEKDLQDKLAADKKAKEEQEKLKTQKTLEAKSAAIKNQQEAEKRKRQEKIDSLLVTAESNLSRVRLKSAYKNYRDILKMDSKNKKAKSGINRVARKYLNLAEREAVNDNFDKADAYLTSANNISPSHSKLATTQQTIFDLRRKHLQYQAEQQIIAKQKAEEKRLAEQEAQKQTTEKPKTSRRAFGGF